MPRVHGRQRNQYARQKTRHIAAEHPHYQAAFQAQVDCFVGAMREHARSDSCSKKERADHRHLDALGERPLLAHQHALEAAGAGQHARQRRGHRELYQQNHQVLLDHVLRQAYRALLGTIIMKLLDPASLNVPYYQSS